MTLPSARVGERLKVNKKTIPFSYWPTKIGQKGNASLQPLLFSLDPCAIIDQAIKKSCPAQAKPEALACMRQARDFYESATEAGKVSAKPLSLYYCMMNLVKAFCLTRGTQSTFNQAQHGLSEQLAAGGQELVNASLQAFPSPNGQGKLQNFSEFKRALTHTGLSAVQTFSLLSLLPQILPGHRLWAAASAKRERFIAIHDVRPMLDRATGNIWLNVYFVSDDLSRLGVTHANFLSESGLTGVFSQVACSEVDQNSRSIICFEQVVPTACQNTKYGNFLQQLFDTLKDKVWTTVASIPPYRRYYVYLCPYAERPSVVHQLLSIYAVSYYLGSITRYRPHHFDSITDKSYGPRIQDFITGQPLQFLYLIASEFAKQEIARPSIV